MLHERDRKLGYDEEDASELASFRYTSRAGGMSRRAIEDIIALKPKMPAEDDPRGSKTSLKLVNEVLDRHGEPQQARNVAMRWFNNVGREMPADVGAFQTQWFNAGDTTPAEASKRLEELRGMVRDRGSDYYRPGSAGAALQNEYRSLLEGGGGSAEPNAGAAATPSAAPAGRAE